jgi:type IV pilus assembly protein PilA
MTKLIKNMRNNEKGFTLIELMIVVAIIGILAAIAIPNFLNYQLKSKTAEAKVNLGAIATSQESWRAENDSYIACGAYPKAYGPSKQTWTKANAGNFTSIGFAPSGDVYYQYEVPAANVSTTAFRATATGDLDDDGTDGGFLIDETRNFQDTNPGQY